MTENKKDYSEMNFTEFNTAIDEDDNLTLVVDAGDWQIWKDSESGRYFFIESGENGAIAYYEVDVVARLTHIDTLNIECDFEMLVDMFDDFDYVGMENDEVEGSITYTWFKKKN